MGTAGTSENGEDPDPPFSGGSSLRVIRAIKKKWEEAKKAHGESGTLPSGSSTPHVAWPRETHENSNYILLRIPIEISKIAHGEKAIAVDEGPLHCSLPLSPAAITRLQDRRLIRLPRPVKTKRLPIDYAALQQAYRRMLADGGFVTQAGLARHLGVSRVWVSRVLKGVKKKAG